MKVSGVSQVLVLCLFAVVVGCSSDTGTIPEDVRVQSAFDEVTSFIKQAEAAKKTSSLEEPLTLLIESLQARVEEYGEPFDKLLAEAKSLQTTLNQDDRDQVKQHLEAMRAVVTEATSA